MRRSAVRSRVKANTALFLPCLFSRKSRSITLDRLVMILTSVPISLCPNQKYQKYASCLSISEIRILFIDFVSSWFRLHLICLSIFWVLGFVYIWCEKKIPWCTLPVDTSYCNQACGFRFELDSRRRRGDRWLLSDSCRRVSSGRCSRWGREELNVGAMADRP